MSHSLKGSAKASTIGEGGVNPPTTTAQAYLILEQTVTSHGHEAVSDWERKIDVAHSPGVAILTPFKWDVNVSSSKKGRVHVPIHNPPLITKGWYLYDISVNFGSVDDATVDNVVLYYDGTAVTSYNSNKNSTFYISFTAEEAKKYAYVSPSGIAIALDLKFPEEKSAINLYSITLLYGAA